MKIESLLIKLMEECAEVTKECAKALTFGLDSYHPEDIESVTNSDKLSMEIGDLMGVINELKKRGILDINLVNHYEKAKIGKMEYWENIKLEKDKLKE